MEEPGLDQQDVDVALGDLREIDDHISEDRVSP
jgi:hypothetical protein